MAKKETTTKTEKPVKKTEELTPEEVFSDKQDTLLTELEKENSKLKLENESLFKDFQKIDGENTELMGKVETLEKIVLETTGVRDNQAVQIQDLKDKLEISKTDNEKLIENETKIVEDRNLLLQQISDLEAELTETKGKLEKYEKRREPQIKPKQGVASNGYFNGNMYGNNYGMY